MIVDNNDVPSKISSALQHVQNTLDKINKLSERHNDLCKSVDTYEKKVCKVKSTAADYIDKITALEKASAYLEVIKKVEELSSSLESGINEKNEKKQITNYIALNDICESLVNSKCTHLLLYVNETVHYWHNILKDHFNADYEEILKTLKWPFIGNILRSTHTTETLNRFQTLTEYLIQIQLYPLHLVNFQY